MSAIHCEQDSVSIDAINPGATATLSNIHGCG